MPDLECRLAKVEANLDHLNQQLIQGRDAAEDKLDAVLAQVTDLKLAQEKQKGFIAGVVFAITAVAGVIGYAVTNWLRN